MNSAVCLIAIYKGLSQCTLLGLFNMRVHERVGFPDNSTSCHSQHQLLKQQAVTMLVLLLKLIFIVSRPFQLFLMFISFDISGIFR